MILEFGQPGVPLFGPFFRWYSHVVLPRVGGWISGQRAAYEYLDRTASQFPAGEAFADLMRQAGGFRIVRARPLAGGVAYVYVGEVA